MDDLLPLDAFDIVALRDVVSERQLMSSPESQMIFSIKFENPDEPIRVCFGFDSLHFVCFQRIL